MGHATEKTRARPGWAQAKGPVGAAVATLGYGVLFGTVIAAVLAIRSVPPGPGPGFSEARLSVPAASAAAPPALR